MTRDKLLKEIGRWCRKRGVKFEVNTRRGKGAHYIVTVGDNGWSTVQSGDLSPRHVNTILDQLGIPRDEIRR